MKILFISFRLSDDLFSVFFSSFNLNSLCSALIPTPSISDSCSVEDQIVCKNLFHPLSYNSFFFFYLQLCFFLFLREISSFTIRAFKVNWRILFDYYKTRYLVVFPLSLFAWFNSQTWHPFAQREKKSRWQTFEKRKKFRDPFSLSFSFFLLCEQVNLNWIIFFLI